MKRTFVVTFRERTFRLPKVSLKEAEEQERKLEDAAETEINYGLVNYERRYLGFRLAMKPNI